ncbi:transcriptional regulator [Clostridia bacterium]|nr:transcriptional regulator [Clostridia bacterium]
MKVFFKYLFITLGSFAVLATAVIFAYSLITGKSVKETLGGLPEIKIFEKTPERVNFAILGMDKDGNRSDVMMVGQFNAGNNYISLVSVPRDTNVIMPEARREILKERGLYVPQSGKMKINAVTHYAGKDLDAEFAVKQLEEIFGIDISYYVFVDIEAFRFIVDEIGGVTFNVPQRMYYNDPYQGLAIDLYPGEQTLNGTQAEGLVRYRKADINNPQSKSYERADLQRAEVQQEFMRALISQAVGRDKVMKNAPALFSAMIKYVRTDFSLIDLTKYIKYAPKISADRIKTATVPGSADGEYFYINEEKLALLVEEMFNGDFTEETEAKTEEIQNPAIYVLNGGHTNGAAGALRDKLKDIGYNVIGVGDYDGAKTERTRIVKGGGNVPTALMDYFVNPQTIEDLTLLKTYAADIVIIIGAN